MLKCSAECFSLTRGNGQAYWFRHRQAIWGQKRGMENLSHWLPRRIHLTSKVAVPVTFCMGSQVIFTVATKNKPTNTTPTTRPPPPAATNNNNKITTTNNQNANNNATITTTITIITIITTTTPPPPPPATTTTTTTTKQPNNQTTNQPTNQPSKQASKQANKQTNKQQHQQQQQQQKQQQQSVSMLNAGQTLEPRHSAVVKLRWCECVLTAKPAEQMCSALGLSCASGRVNVMHT